MTSAREMGLYILDERGEAIPFNGDSGEWGRWFERAERRVGLDFVGDLRVARYSTRREALDGHADVIRRLRAGEPLP